MEIDRELRGRYDYLIYSVGKGVDVMNRTCVNKGSIAIGWTIAERHVISASHYLPAEM